MKPIKVVSSFFSIVAAFSSVSLLAQSFEVNPVADAPPFAVLQPTSSIGYKNAAVEYQLAGVNTLPGFENGTNASLNVNLFRVDSLGMTNSSSNMLSRNDRASFTVDAPMPVVNGALCFAGTVSQAPLDSSVTRWTQVLSLAATRKINASFAYSAKFSKYSSLDSAITYRLHPASDSGISDVVASIQYSLKF